MGKGKTRRKFRFISKEELIQKFSFLSEWESDEVAELYTSLKLKTRSDERLKRVSQQEIDKYMSKNPILATLPAKDVKGHIISLRLSLLDQFDQESLLGIKQIVKKQLLKKNELPRPLIYHIIKQIK